MSDMCGDNRFEIIEKAKRQLLKDTNISSSPDEMKVLDSFLFRCWQMGWLNPYNVTEDGVYFESFAVKDSMVYINKVISIKDASTTLTCSLVDGMQKIWC